MDHTSKLDMLRELGATEVIDYTREDFTQLGRAYDIIFDVVGKSDYRRSLAALNPGGRYIIANPKLNHFFRRMWTQATSDKRVIVQPSSRGDAAFAELSALVAQGVLTPIVDKVYALADTAEAHRYVDSGQKKGNVVIQIVAE